MKKKYRKKPVVIEAEQFTQAHVAAHLFDKAPLPQGVRCSSASYHAEQRRIYSASFSVETINGEWVAIRVGDWIMPERDGIHFYPCDPDVFAATYEPVDEQ